MTKVLIGRSPERNPAVRCAVAAVLVHKQLNIRWRRPSFVLPAAPLAAAQETTASPKIRERRYDNEERGAAMSRWRRNFSS